MLQCRIVGRHVELGRVAVRVEVVLQQVDLDGLAGTDGPTWSSTAIGATASVAAMTVTVTVAVAVPPRPSSTEYVKATSPGDPSGVTASAGGVNVTAPPPSATAATPPRGSPPR